MIDPFYTLSPVNTAGCEMRERAPKSVGGVSVLTFVDRPGHIAHSNFVHSMRVLGYGPHVNLDVDLTAQCREVYGIAAEHEVLECVYRERLKEYLPALRRMEPEAVVLVSDTFDALLFTPAAQLRTTFASAYRCKDGGFCKVVIGSEMLCDTQSCRTDHDRKRQVRCHPSRVVVCLVQFLRGRKLTQISLTRLWISCPRAAVAHCTSF